VHFRDKLIVFEFTWWWLWERGGDTLAVRYKLMIVPLLTVCSRICAGEREGGGGGRANLHSALGAASLDKLQCFAPDIGMIWVIWEVLPAGIAQMVTIAVILGTTVSFSVRPRSKL